jgi:hypothetical protein
MSTPIGYVETIREDLLDAAWRSTMSSPMRARRRLPSKGWLVAAATTVTLVAAGVIGWVVLRPEPVTRLASGQLGTPTQGNEAGHRAGLVPAASPAADALRAPTPQYGAQANDSREFAGPTPVEAAPGALAVPGLGAINPPVDLSKVIKTASLTIIVGHDAFGERFSQVGDVADRLGGYISSSSTSGGKSGFVTIRVPAKRFQEALRSLRGLGRVDSENVRGRDVTAEYVDLTARVDIALARRRVLFGLMDKAVSIEQTIRVQNALDDVQLRIEELQGQINVLNDRVSQATIRVSVRETGVKPEAETTVENPSIGGALDHAIAGFFSVLAGVIVGLGWLIPALLVLALLWFVVMRVRRRLA